MQRHRPSLNQTARSQRGGMALTMMLVMLGLVLMLGLVEIGYLYWAKRDAQKTADLAALAGAQRLDLCTAGNADNTAARRNGAVENAFPGTLSIQCGNWNPEAGSGDHFVQGTTPAIQINAVKVVASRGVIPFFGINESLPTVSAQAVAKRSVPMAVFSVGSQLLRINGNSPLGTTLRAVGVDVSDTTLLDYNGLGQVNVTPGGLLEALGIPVDADLSIANFNALLAANTVRLGQLLDATATVVGQDGVAVARIQALRNALATQANLDTLMVTLGSAGTEGGLFAQIIAPDGSTRTALQANVNVLDLLNTGISVATSGNGVAINKLNVLGDAVKVRAGVVEPASIGIGGIGTFAYNAQVRVSAEVDTNGVPLLGPVINALKIRLHLPVYADVTTAMGELTEFQCGASVPRVKIKVTNSILRSCVGDVAVADRFSKSSVCSTGLQDTDMLTLLGATLVRDRINLNVLPDVQEVTLAAGETVSTRVNPLLIGDSIDALVRELLRVLSNILSPNSARLSTSQASLELADRYLTASSTAGQRYDIEKTISLLRYGNESLGIRKITANEWTIKDGIPRVCALVLTCYSDGLVFDSFRATVKNADQGLVGSLLGGVLGGLLIDNCNNLLGGLFSTYNDCVKRNLAKFLQTAPEGVLDPNAGGGVTTPGTGPVQCSGLLCALLNPVLNLLKPILNSVGDLLRSILTSVLGLELGRTDVHVQSIQCSTAQLVY